MRFELKAIGPGGAVEALDFQAPDEVTAVRQLEGRGYTVLSVRAKGSLGLPWRRGGERFPVALFSQELRVLLNAGLPLPEAIDTLAQKEKRGDWRGIIERLVEVLREGQTFSNALEEFPQTFSPLYVATVRSSEKTSDLAPALGRYVAYAAQLEAIKKRVVNASIYPALLIGVGGIVSLFLLLYVVPRFGRIYEERGSALPLFSRLLLTWGSAVDKHAPVFLSVFGGLIVLGVYALRLANVRTRSATRCGACRRSASASGCTSWHASTAPSACCCAAARRSCRRSTWAGSSCTRSCASGSRAQAGRSARAAA